MKRKKSFFSILLLISLFILPSQTNIAQAAGEIPVVSISSPNGAETFTAGQTVTISWNQSFVDTVTIGYKTCPSCLDWISNGQAVDINSNTGSYLWKIPDNMQPGTNYQIDIIAYHTGVGSVNVVSNSFTIQAAESVAPVIDPMLAASANSIAASDAYKSVVKVKSYAAVNDKFLEQFSQGSGVILNSGGLVLTNDHVVSLRSEYDDSDYPVAYQICLTENSNLEPNCDYLAKLVAKDKGADLALLQIISYPKGRKIIEFPHLNLSQTDSGMINDPVVAIGYPSIGGDTVTITQGIISGKLDKYNKKWIKTDAVVSFGSSGGAAINSAGEVIGITTEVYSDVSGGLGYLLNSASIGDWVGKYQTAAPQNSSLLNRLAELTNQQKILKTSNKFINNYPNFSIDKPAGWTFFHSNENSLSIVNREDEDSGSVTITIIKAPFFLDKASVKNALLRYFNEQGVSSVLKISKEADSKLGGVPGKLVTLSVSQYLFNAYLIPHKEFLILLEYNYGDNDNDKALVDGIIKSLKISANNQKFSEVHKYSNASPKFTISTGANWPMIIQDNKAIPLKLQNKNIKEAFVLFGVSKINDTLSKASANELLAAAKSGIDSSNQLAASIDSKYVVEKSGVNYKINKNVTALYYIDGVEKTVSQNKILAFDRDYFIKSGKAIIRVNLTVFTSNRAVFNKALAEFNKMLQGLALK